MRRAVLIGVAVVCLAASGCRQAQEADASEDGKTTAAARQTAQTGGKQAETSGRQTDTQPSQGETYQSDDPMAFCNLFPDPAFASAVAALFDKRPEQVTSYPELAGYTGGLEFMYQSEDMRPVSIEGIGLLTGLTSFDFYKTPTEALPPEIGKLKNLRELNLMKAFWLRRIPKEIGQMESLEYLCVSLTELETLPEEIGNLGKLKTLRADNTQITAVPASIGRLKNLQVLDLHSNELDSVPGSLCDLTSLRYLNISYTQMKALPADIGKLTNLEIIDLFGCRLTRIPDSARNLKKLTYFNVYDNFQLREDYKTYIPREVYECKNSSSLGDLL